MRCGGPTGDATRENRILLLLQDRALARTIASEARRHFGRDEEMREDAASEAWLAIVLSIGSAPAEVLAHRGISNLYKRERRRRLRLQQYARGLRPWLENNA